MQKQRGGPGWSLGSGIGADGCARDRPAGRPSGAGGARSGQGAGALSGEELELVERADLTAIHGDPRDVEGVAAGGEAEAGVVGEADVVAGGDHGVAVGAAQGVADGVGDGADLLVEDIGEEAAGVGS